MHLLLSVVLYAPGLLVFIYARRTHQLENALRRREMALIGLLLGCWPPAGNLDVNGIAVAFSHC